MNENSNNKVVNFLKTKWWLTLILLLLLLLVLIPTQSGLPDENYVGCEVEGALCQYSSISSITKESDGSATISFSAKITDDENQTLTYNLPGHSADTYSVGNTVFMNYSPDDKRMVLFVGHKSNLLVGLTLDQISSPAATAVINSETGEVIN